MKKLITALLIGVLASNIPAAGMEKDNQSHQQTKSYFWTFANFIPKKLWATAWWKDYLCTHRTSARQWHAEKAAKKVADWEDILNKELNTILPSDPKSIPYTKAVIEDHKRERPYVILPIELNQTLMKRLKQLGYSDCPNIVEDPKSAGGTYDDVLDLIRIPPYIRGLFEDNFSAHDNLYPKLG